MTEYIANMLTKNMYMDGLIKESEESIYSYSIQLIVEKIIGFSAIYMIALFQGYFFETNNMKINMIIFLVSAMVIFVLGAVNHPGMDWNKEEFEENKKLARITVFVELLVVIALTYLGMAEKYILFMSFGMILCAILLTLGKITGQEVKCDE